MSVVLQTDRLTLNFPAQAAQPTVITSTMINAFNAQPQAALTQEDLVLVFNSEDEVAALTPRFCK